MLKKEAEKQKEKRLARAAIKRRLSTITEEENREAGQAMLTYLRQSNAYRMARVVFCFVSTKKEPDTTPFLQQVLNDGKRLCVPLCVGKGQMEAREITSLDQLKPGLFGILEPKEDTPLVSEKDIDFCAAPCLASDMAAVTMTALCPSFLLGATVWCFAMKKCFVKHFPQEKQTTVFIASLPRAVWYAWNSVRKTKKHPRRIERLFF